jgi:multiple sugar transport system permease protein
MLINYRARRVISTVALYALIALALLIIVFPLYWLIITSVKFDLDSAHFPPIFVPSRLTFNSYALVLQTENAAKFWINSIGISLSTTFLTCIIGSLAAYALAKTYLAGKLRQLLILWILVIRIFPPVTTAIPYYIIIKNLGLSDTWLSLILTYVSYGLPFVIWLMLGFFQDLPADIEKAAIVDGCGMWQRFTQVVLPLTLPGLTVTAIFAFIASWNEFLFASILTSYSAKTLPVVISGYMSDKYLRWGEMSALGTMMIIPVMVFSALTQKYLVRGLTFGAVKG